VCVKIQNTQIVKTYYDTRIILEHFAHSKQLTLIHIIPLFVQMPSLSRTFQVGLVFRMGSWLTIYRCEKVALLDVSRLFFARYSILLKHALIYSILFVTSWEIFQFYSNYQKPSSHKPLKHTYYILSSYRTLKLNCIHYL
jgi:hypothetical protein